MANNDVRRVGGWLPADQEDLEAWLAGHRERVAAKGEQVPLHPVIVEFQELIDTDPVVRMYVSEMIAQVPRSRQLPQAAPAQRAAAAAADQRGADDGAGVRRARRW